MMKKTDPLLDDGMVALLRWLEKTRPRILADIHGKCLETTGDHATVYKRKRSEDDWIEISHRDDPENPTGRMILDAIVYGEGWLLSRDIMSNDKFILTNTLQARLGDVDLVMGGRDIIDHPYLSETGAEWGMAAKGELILNVYRKPATHVLTPKGIEALP